MSSGTKRGDCFFSRLNAFVVCSLFILLVGIAGLIACVVLRKQQYLPTKFHYGMVVDAGSSHTDLQIFRWRSDHKFHETANVNEISSSTCSRIGISSFKQHPKDAGIEIEKCVKETINSVIPKKDQSNSPVYVGATAGMRLLCRVNNTVCQNILESIRDSLHKTNLATKNDSVRVLSGQEEAVFGWISLNLLTKSILPSSLGHNTYGTLDLGGASFEVAFVPDNQTIIPTGYNTKLNLYGNDYQVYSHSYLCYGINEAERRMQAKLVEDSGYADIVTNPCFPTGYTTNVTSDYLWKAPCSSVHNVSRPNNKNFTMNGGSSYEDCKKSFRFLFNESAHCDNQPCSFNGIYQPPLHGRFGAFSVISLIADLMNITRNASLNTFNNASQDICSKNWTKVIKSFPQLYTTSYMQHLCFEAAYSYSLIVDGLHFHTDSKQIEFLSTVHGSKVSWALGLMVNATNLIPNTKWVPKLASDQFIAAIVGATMLCLVAIVLIMYFCVCRHGNSTITYHHVEDD